ncbi:hypothetical protein [Halocatena halophila]|uniref:hypothetical protein n=1 Tax=Halocatena halophila TaxID=2814576 RepID=UPI002ED6075F
MTTKLRTALTALLLLGLLAGATGPAVAETTEINSGETTVVSDNDLIELDHVANNISVNVLGVQVDDSEASLLSS